jgi:hypothetical protein
VAGDLAAEVAWAIGGAIDRHAAATRRRRAGRLARSSWASSWPLRHRPCWTCRAGSRPLT